MFTLPSVFSPLPPIPVLVRLTVPALMLKVLSHFIAAQLLMSALSGSYTAFPLVLTVIVPPAIVIIDSLLMPFTALPVVVMLSVPLFMMNWPLLVSLSSLVHPTSMPSPPVVLIVMLPPSIWKYWLTCMPSLAEFATLIVPLVMRVYSSLK